MLFNKTLDRQLQTQPKEIKFCKKCVVSNQRPRISFNEEGICSACEYANLKENSINWEERERQLHELLDGHRSKDGSYDCIVPSSGGKDSNYVAHQLKYVYGMHPLTVTWAPFLYTDVGWENYLNFKDSGFDNFLCFPNGIMHRKLARLAFELLGDAWEPFAYGQKSYAFHMATKFNIPLIFYGESGEVEYGGSIKNIEKSHEEISDWQDFYYKGSGIDELIKYGLDANYITHEEIQHNSLELYRPPNPGALEKTKPKMHWFSFYKKWIPQENYYYAAEHTGFQANFDGRSEGTYSKYASLDDKTDGFHFFLGYIKFGLGRASRDAQMETRCQHLTREEAVALVKRYDGEFPKKYFRDFINYLDITPKEFWQVADFYRENLPHLWEKRNNTWVLKHTVWGEEKEVPYPEEL